MQQRQLKDKSQQQILPITHTDSVRDSSGNTLTSLLGAVHDEVELVSESTLENRGYSPSTFSGKGRQVLQKNIVSNKNVLAQAQINSGNTVYVIQYDFNLNGGSITVPSGCTLDFQGGTLQNGSININGAKILPSYEYITVYSAECAPSGISPLIVTGTPATGTCRFKDERPSWWSGTEWVDGEGVNLDTAIINV